MDRRVLLSALGAGLVAALGGCGTVPDGDGLSRSSGGWQDSPSSRPARTPAPTLAASASPSVLPGNPAPAAVPTSVQTAPAGPLPPSRVRFGRPGRARPRPFPAQPISALPTGRNQIALTIDDGVDSDVVAGYAEICARTGLRLTFFCNGIYPSWTENAPALRPMVDSGQIVLANHTWSHQALTQLTEPEIAFQLEHNAAHFRNLYGVTGQPFLRPPYGYLDQRVLTTVHELGYPGVVMWYGNLGDDQIISPAQVLANAQTWLTRGRIVIGHANHPAVTYVYDQLVELIHDRGLQPVTIADAYPPPRS